MGSKRKERSNERIVKYAIWMVYGQAISFIFNFWIETSKIEKIKKGIQNTKKSLASYDIKIDGNILTIKRYKTNPEEANYVSHLGIICWQASKMQPGEFCTFLFSNGTDLPGIVQIVQSELLEVQGKRFGVSSFQDGEDSFIAIQCFKVNPKGSVY